MIGSEDRVEEEAPAERHLLRDARRIRPGCDVCSRPSGASASLSDSWSADAAAARPGFVGASRGLRGDEAQPVAAQNAIAPAMTLTTGMVREAPSGEGP